MRNTQFIGFFLGKLLKCFYWYYFCEIRFMRTKKNVIVFTAYGKVLGAGFTL